MTSPPSRGAWIEIAGVFAGYVENRGRPPRGGRGLKYFLALLPSRDRKSRPPRGGRGLKLFLWFALWKSYHCRPPRGGRGLKYNPGQRGQLGQVAPLAGGVD